MENWTNFIFLALLLHFPQLVYSVSGAAIKYCRKEDLQFFDVAKLPDGGVLEEVAPNGTHGIVSEWCLENPTLCKVWFYRHYLPPREKFMIYFEDNRKQCDAALSSAVDTWMKTYSRIQKAPGRPYLKWNDKVSVGKYMRYATDLNYGKFKGLTSDTLIDIDYSMSIGFPWADEVPPCWLGGHAGSWNCFFEHFNSTTSAHYTAMANNPSLPLLDPSIDDMNSVFHYRSAVSHHNHVIQMMFYAKILSILAEPSTISQQYMTDNLVSTNTHVWDNRYSSTPSGQRRRRTRIRKRRRGLEQEGVEHTQTTTQSRTFRSYESFVQYATDIGTSASAVLASFPSPSSSEVHHQHFTSVSMHVRQGDACDYMVESNEEQAEFKDRPCYSVDLYMKHLHALRLHYNVKRVFLSTDSEEMIQRTQDEVLFNWVYMNISRGFLGKQNGWVELRKDKENLDIVFSAVADLNLLRYGDIFLGAFSSHYSVLGYYLMNGQSMRIGPFVSIDKTLDCVTWDNCSTTWLSQQNINIDTMLQHWP